jgi:hypothetical protein
MTETENRRAKDAVSAAVAGTNDMAAAGAGAAQYRDWIAAKALPVWSTAGFDAGQGMFQERLDWSGRPQGTVPRPAMVQPPDPCLRPCRATWLVSPRRTPR